MLQHLRKKDIKFVWEPDQIESMELLKEGVRQAKAIHTAVGLQRTRKDCPSSRFFLYWDWVLYLSRRH